MKANARNTLTLTLTLLYRAIIKKKKNRPTHRSMIASFASFVFQLRLTNRTKKYVSGKNSKFGAFFVCVHNCLYRGYINCGNKCAYKLTKSVHFLQNKNCHIVDIYSIFTREKSFHRNTFLYFALIFMDFFSFS